MADAPPGRVLDQSGVHRPKNSLSQLLRLLRTELTLYVRYGTVWLYLLVPFVFVAPALFGPAADLVSDVSASVYFTAGGLIGFSLFTGIVHPANVATARRETLFLKRLRVSGVSPSAIHGAMVLNVVLLCVVMAALTVVPLTALTGTPPADPVMVLLAVVLSAVSMSLLGLLLSPMARTAEVAQMLSIVPTIILLLLSGITFPLDILPGQIHLMLWLLPLAPAVDLARSGYTGLDLFGATASSEQLPALELWVSALPAIGVQLGWTVLLGLLVRRCFAWDPRQP